MYFASFNELWLMSGHGFYVWLAYGISISVLIALTIYPVHKKSRMLQAIKQRALQNPGDSHGDAS